MLYKLEHRYWKAPQVYLNCPFKEEMLIDLIYCLYSVLDEYYQIDRADDYYAANPYLVSLMLADLFNVKVSSKPASEQEDINHYCTVLELYSICNSSNDYLDYKPARSCFLDSYKITPEKIIKCFQENKIKLAEQSDKGIITRNALNCLFLGTVSREFESLSNLLLCKKFSISQGTDLKLSRTLRHASIALIEAANSPCPGLGHLYEISNYFKDAFRMLVFSLDAAHFQDMEDFELHDYDDEEIPF